MIASAVKTNKHPFPLSAKYPGSSWLAEFPLAPLNMGCVVEDCGTTIENLTIRISVSVSVSVSHTFSGLRLGRDDVPGNERMAYRTMLQTDQSELN
jgi:hypothetical protein